MPKILLCGYYGFNNAGDEAILRGVVDGIGREVPDARITVLSRHPAYTKKKHPVQAIGRMNLPRILLEMARTDLLVSGGGSLFQDVTSQQSLWYYLGVLWLAKKIFHRPVMVYSQGIGPVTRPFNRFLLKRALRGVDCINVRDQSSVSELADLGITENILVTADTVFGIEQPSLEDGQKRLKALNACGRSRYVGISVRHWPGYDTKIRKETRRLVREIIDTTDCIPVLVPFHFYEDLRLVQEIAAGIPKHERKRLILIEDYLYVDQYLSLIGCFEVMVSMRLHGLIFAVLMGVAPIGISYDPKVDSFLETVEESPPVSVGQMDGKKLAAKVRHTLDTPEDKTRTRQALEALRAQVRLHNQKVNELLEKRRYG